MDISDWLRGLGLAQYAEAFRKNAIDAEALPELTEADLEELGVLLGHRKRILRAIAALARKAPPHAPADAQAGYSDGAERRQLSVMFCDICDSTALSTRLDPEDLSAVVRDYQDCVRSTIARFGGFIARYVGDGVLIYFGWPVSHETDAESAVRAALAVIAAIRQTTIQGERLSIRISIATGLVVVGVPIGEGEARQQIAIGETLNLAARLQTLADPNTLVIADGTRSQIGSLFDLEDLGPRRLAGFAVPQRAWRVISESGAESRFEALRSGATPLIGRDEELELVLRRWQRAKGGEGRIVLISGEPGIGKSRLTAALLEELSRETYTRLRYFCSPHHADSTLYPFTNQLERAAGFERGDSPAVRLDKLDALLARTGTLPEDVGLVANLMSLPHTGRYPVLDLTPQRRRQRMLDILAAQLDALAVERPVLMIFEDAHWADPTSLELLAHTLPHIRRLSVLVLVTFRPEFTPHWAGQLQVTSLTLSRLGPEESAALVQCVAGNANLPKALLEEIIERADGVPLFAEELTKATLEAGEAEARARLAAVPTAAGIVPPTLYTSLMARLDRLRPGREVAQIGAAIGREFSHELIGAVAGRPEPELRLALDQLVSAELVFARGRPPEANYLFKHALVQDVAYGALLRGQRRELHARIAEVLEQQFPETVETQPELLAYHLARAGLAPKAVRYWLRAGERAASVSANKEAITHLQAGIDTLHDVPGSPEDLRLELDLNSALVAVLQVMHGYGSDIVGTTVDRVVELCRRGGEEELLAPVLFQSWLFNHMRAAYPTGRLLANELHELAARSSDAAPRLAACFANGLAHFAAGEHLNSFRNFADGARIYREMGGGQTSFRYGFAAGPACCAYTGWVQATLGYCDQALEGSHSAAEVINKTKHAYTMARGLVWCSFIAAVCRDWATAHEFGDQAVRTADEHGFEMPAASGAAVRGVARAMLEPNAPMPIEVSTGIARYTQTGGRTQTQLPFLLTLIAEAWVARGDWGAANEVLTRAAELMIETGERHVEAETYRLQGILLEASGRGDPEPLLLRALEVARAQEARLYELRAARSLALLWRTRGKPERARTALAPVYSWFTEGFAMPDLVETRAVLDLLSCAGVTAGQPRR